MCLEAASLETAQYCFRSRLKLKREKKLNTWLLRLSRRLAEPSKVRLFYYHPQKREGWFSWILRFALPLQFVAGDRVARPSCTRCIWETRLHKCDDEIVPDKLCDLRDLNEVLQVVEKFHSSICSEPSHKLRYLLQLVEPLLNEARDEHFACKLKEVARIGVVKVSKKQSRACFKQS